MRDNGGWECTSCHKMNNKQHGKCATCATAKPLDPWVAYNRYYHYASSSIFGTAVSGGSGRGSGGSGSGGSGVSRGGYGGNGVGSGKKAAEVHNSYQATASNNPITTQPTMHPNALSNPNLIERMTDHTRTAPHESYDHRQQPPVTSTPSTPTTRHNSSTTAALPAEPSGAKYQNRADQQTTTEHPLSEEAQQRSSSFSYVAAVGNSLVNVASAAVSLLPYPTNANAAAAAGVLVNAPTARAPSTTEERAERAPSSLVLNGREMKSTARGGRSIARPEPSSSSSSSSRRSKSTGSASYSQGRRWIS
jgi:hypothetical protein